MTIKTYTYVYGGVTHVYKYETKSWNKFTNEDITLIKDKYLKGTKKQDLCKDYNISNYKLNKLLRS